MPVPTPSPPRYDAAYLNNPKPGYPAISRRLQEQGEVLLRVLVSTSGQAEQVELSRSSGHPRLDRAATDAVRRWRFEPARSGDQVVESWILVPIIFKIEGS